MKFKSQGYSSSTPCPSCGSRTFEIIESRTTKTATRRRKQCQACGHRCTTYEVSSSWFRQAEDNAKLRDVLLKQLAVAPAVVPVQDQPPLCSTCDLAAGASCSLGLPEYDTEEAADCLHFRSVQTPNTRYIA
jgi:hypothetical protein